MLCSGAHTRKWISSVRTCASGPLIVLVYSSLSQDSSPNSGLEKNQATNWKILALGKQLVSYCIFSQVFCFFLILLPI